jgi:hypothetical protein
MKKNLERKSQIVITDKDIAKAEIFFGVGTSLVASIFKERMIDSTFFWVGTASYIIGGLTYLNYMIDTYGNRKD